MAPPQTSPVMPQAGDVTTLGGSNQQHNSNGRGELVDKRTEWEKEKQDGKTLAVRGTKVDLHDIQEQPSSPAVRGASIHRSFGLNAAGGGAFGPGQSRPAIQIPTSNEELWVISKPDQPAAQAKDDAVPGAGALLAKLPDNPAEQVAVPLKHTDVKASIAGYIATVDVIQQYQNPY
ncbi:MAG TPA: hypothetical protein VH518_09235, partial [Tepidisphaeraceae bacterium]